MLPLPLHVSSAAVHVTAAAARVICGHVRRRCGPCVLLLGLQYSHVIEKKKLVKKRQRKNENTSRGSHRHREIAAAGRACCLRLCVLLPPLCILSAAVHVAAALHVAAAVHVAAAGHAYHHHTCRLWPCVSLLGLQYSHVIEKK
jgi:hypothetical protein